jgi:hypothetical protein
VRPVIRPSLILLLVLFSLSAALPSIHIAVPVVAFVAAIIINFLIAVRHVRSSTF